MKALTPHQRDAAIRRISRELAYHHADKWEKERYRHTAEALVDALQWTGVHGTSEKRAVELIVSRLNEEAEATG